MTLSEFLNKYKVGKSYGYNGTYVGQCVSLVKNYIKEVLGVTPQAIGDAKDYWSKRNTAYIKGIFTPIANTPSFVPQRGDVFVRTSGTYGHIGIVLEATQDYFYTVEQNYNGCKVVKNIKHTDWHNINFLRPKNQSNIATVKNSSSNGSFPKPVKWQNGNTPEMMYAGNDLKSKVFSLNKNASAWCYSKAGSAYLIVATFDGGKHATAGFVGYAGGLTSAPPESKVWKNGSTSETVYANVDKTIKVGTLSPYESCYCLGKIDGMYLVLYTVTGTDIQKCGFVDYHGECK